MRLTRMTVRRWMIIIAAIGLVTGGIVGFIRMQRLRAHLNLLAKRHAALESMFQRRAERIDASIKLTTKELDVFAKTPSPLNGRSVLEPVRKLLVEEYDKQAAAARLTAYHTLLKQKYEYAAQHPWLPVEPDPPIPD